MLKKINLVLLLIITGCFQAIVSCDQNGRRQLHPQLAAIVEQIRNTEPLIPSSGFLLLTDQENQILKNRFDAVKNLPRNNPERMEIEENVRFLQTFSRQLNQN